MTTIRRKHLTLCIMLVLISWSATDTTPVRAHDANNTHGGVGDGAYFDYTDVESEITMDTLSASVVASARSTWSSTMDNMDIGPSVSWLDIDVTEVNDGSGPPGSFTKHLRAERDELWCGTYWSILEAGNIQYMDIELNSGKINTTTLATINAWRISNSIPTITLNDYLERVASHEYGHAMGLVDVDNTCVSVMHPKPPNDDTDPLNCNPFIKQPTSLDDTNINTIYSVDQGVFCEEE